MCLDGLFLRHCRLLRKLCEVHKGLGRLLCLFEGLQSRDLSKRSFDVLGVDPRGPSDLEDLDLLEREATDGLFGQERLEDLRPRLGHEAPDEHVPET